MKNPSVYMEFVEFAGCINSLFYVIKGPHMGLRSFLTIESPLEMMKNALYFMLNAFFFFEIFTFLF